MLSEIWIQVATKVFPASYYVFIKHVYVFQHNCGSVAADAGTAKSEGTLDSSNTGSTDAPSEASKVRALPGLSNLDGGAGRPILAYESGSEDDDDLVEQIDADFTVRSPWMTDVAKTTSN